VCVFEARRGWPGHSDADVFGEIDELRWTGPTKGFAKLCEQLGAPQLADRATRLADL
jgi:hypothetical protein